MSAKSGRTGWSPAEGNPFEPPVPAYCTSRLTAISAATTMSDYAISVAKATHHQLKDVFALSDDSAWHGLGLTSMIGVDDVVGETFALSDPADVRSFAEEKGLAWLSIWAFRNRQCDSGTSTSTAQTDCGEVKQGTARSRRHGRAEAVDHRLPLPKQPTE